MPQRSPEVEQIVRNWLDAKQAADGTAIRAGLSDYCEALAIGTDASEWWAGAAAFADAHAAGSGFTASLEHVEAHSHGPVAWAAVRALVETGEAGGMPVRLTLVLVQAGDGGWRVAHSHASVPDAG
jgi:ketosteroid isomerase-like protein